LPGILGRHPDLLTELGAPSTRCEKHYYQTWINGIQFKASKCQFHIQEPEYLGFIVNPNGIKMDLVKVKAITKWEPPKSVHDTQVFIGFVNFYCRFIEGFSRIAQPLFKKLSKETKFHWDEQDQTAFELLKERFTKALILAHYYPRAHEW